MTTIAARRTPAAELLIDLCADLLLDVSVEQSSGQGITVRGPSGEQIDIDLRDGRLSMLEQVLRGMRFDFTELPLLVLGDSKEIRLLTPRIAVAKLLPTVYSFTHNRYGVIAGTEQVRARFSADVFRAMAAEPGPLRLSSAFLGLIESEHGPLLVERRVQVCNLEIRVKRFHIGSPLHRYLYTEQHPTVAGPALNRWDRFADPIVCFDWRHPLTDGDGRRLADEPISDDYAGVWMSNVANAKALALDTFSWLEHRFERSGLRLIDICFFVDRTGTVVYGEISPDCMRVRARAADDAEGLDKDQWRSGGEPGQVLGRYQLLHHMVFPEGEHHLPKEEVE